MLRYNVPESEPEFDEKLSLDFPDFKPSFKLSEHKSFIVG